MVQDPFTFKDDKKSPSLTKQSSQQAYAVNNSKYCYEYNDANSPSALYLFDENGYPLQQLATQFGIPEFDECIQTNECTSSGPQKQKGHLFLYNSKLCFYSKAPLKAAGFTKATLVQIPYGSVIEIYKAKLNAFSYKSEFGIYLTLDDNSKFLLVGFKSINDLDSALSCIQQLHSWQLKLTPTPEDLSVEYIRMQLSKIRGSEEEIKIIELDNEIEDEEWEEMIIERESDDKEAIKSINQVNFYSNHTFDERSRRLKKLVLENEEVLKAKWTTLALFKVSAKETFILFFGNNEFEDEQKKKHDTFQTFFTLEVMKEKEAVFSDIYPDPPQFYSDLFSKEVKQILNCPDYSERTLEFTHYGKSALSPSKTKCLIKEKIYFLTPYEFIIVKDISFQGIPLSDCFQPRSVIHVREESNSTNTIIKTGFYIRYLKDTLFKSVIEKTSFKENSKNISQITPLFVKYAKLWSDKRGQEPKLFKNIEASNLATKHHFGKPPCHSPEIEFGQIIELDNEDPPVEENQIQELACASNSICSIF